jgi:hypothetical protein
MEDQTDYTDNSDGSWSGLLSTVKDTVAAGAGVYSSLQNNVATPAAGTTATTSAPVDFTKFVPFAIIGVVLLAIVFFLKRK